MCGCSTVSDIVSSCVDAAQFLTLCLRVGMQHYQQDEDGLCTRLIEPVQKKGTLEFAIDQQAFVDQGWVIRMKDLQLGEAIGGGEYGGRLRGTGRRETEEGSTEVG